VSTTTLCGYNGRAVDFIMTNGLLEEIRLQRSSRKNLHLPQATYGVFNGQFLDGTHLEMLRPTVIELAGAPQSVEMVTGANPWNTVERDYYESAIFEYDRTTSGNIVLGGVILKNPATAQPTASAEPIASGRPAPSAGATPSVRPAASARRP